MPSNCHFRAFDKSIVFVSSRVVSVTTFLQIVGHRVQLFFTKGFTKMIGAGSQGLGFCAALERLLNL